MKFSDVIKTLCVCGCVFGSMCEDTRGMGKSNEHIFRRDNVKITSIRALLELKMDLPSDQSNTIPPVLVRGMELDRVFVDAWENKFVCHVDSQGGVFQDTFELLAFENCSIDPDFFPTLLYGVFSSLSVIELRIQNCALTMKQAEDIISEIYYGDVELIDFSNNKLGGASNGFEDILISNVFPRMGKIPIILRDNGFSDEDITALTEKYDNLIF